MIFIPRSSINLYSKMKYSSKEKADVCPTYDDGVDVSGTGTTSVDVEARKKTHRHQSEPGTRGAHAGGIENLDRERTSCKQINKKKNQITGLKFFTQMALRIWLGNRCPWKQITNSNHRLQIFYMLCIENLDPKWASCKQINEKVKSQSSNFSHVWDQELG